nr:hypothetical protein [Saprospiraceae bacterium]
MTTPSSVPSKPYADDATNSIYELLFCDSINLYKPDASALLAYPWNILFDPEPEQVDLEKIVFDDQVESRI